jgi:glutathione S-transferase
MANYTLISFDICPFVQRSVITLEEKGVQYEIKYIEIENKPDWFLSISPFGKVPVLQVDDTVIFESAVINEYLDETAPGRKLHPADPLQRAHNRAWIEFSSSLLVDRNRMQHAKEETEARELAGILNSKLGHIEGQLGEGPYFNGERFSLVDAAAAPLFQRLGWLLELAPDLGVFDGLPKVAAWSAALIDRESVKNSTVSDIHERYIGYLQGKRKAGDKTTSWLGSLAA